MPDPDRTGSTPEGLASLRSLRAGLQALSRRPRFQTFREAAASPASDPRAGPGLATRSARRTRPARRAPYTRAPCSGSRAAASRGRRVRSLLTRLDESQAQIRQEGIEEFLLLRREIPAGLVAQEAEKVHALPREDEVHLGFHRFRVRCLTQVDQSSRGEAEQEGVEVDGCSSGGGCFKFTHHPGSFAALLVHHSLGVSSSSDSSASSSSAMLVCTGWAFSATSGRLFKRRS